MASRRGFWGTEWCSILTRCSPQQPAAVPGDFLAFGRWESCRRRCRQVTTRERERRSLLFGGGERVATSARCRHSWPGRPAEAFADRGRYRPDSLDGPALRDGSDGSVLML